MPSVKNVVITVAGMGKRSGLGKAKCLVKVRDKNYFGIANFQHTKTLKSSYLMPLSATRGGGTVLLLPSQK